MKRGLSAPKEVRYTTGFERQLQKAPLKIKQAFRARRALFLDDLHNPQLHNHLLTGDLKKMDTTGQP